MQAIDNTSVPILTIARYTFKGYIKERVLLVVLIFAFILMTSSYVLAPLAVGAQKKIVRLNALYAKLEDTTANYPRTCQAGDATCEGTPIICMHDQANGKTIQHCEGECAYVSGTWMKGNVTCNQGILFQ